LAAASSTSAAASSFAAEASSNLRLLVASCPTRVFWRCIDVALLVVRAPCPLGFGDIHLRPQIWDSIS
jgi:hypothetical protein